MRRPENNVDKIFLCSAYGAHYRQMARARWSVDVSSGYTIVLILEGRMEFHRGDSSGTLTRSSAVLLNPGHAASGRGTDVEFLTVSLSPSYVLDCAVRARLVRSGAVVNFHANVLDQDERLMRLSVDLRDELTDSGAGQELVIHAIVEQMIVHLLRHHSHVRRSDELELSRAGLVDRRIRRAIELMHANLDRDLPLEEIASAAYLSPFHFARLFKKLTGATPHAYLASLRATRAQSLLAETDLSVTEISAQVGYASSSHFSKAFRQATGMTPRAFRGAVVRGTSD